MLLKKRNVYINLKLMYIYTYIYIYIYIYIYVSKINKYVNVLHIMDLGIHGRSRNCQLGQGG